jgi:hypothetical protein
VDLVRPLDRVSTTAGSGEVAVWFLCEGIIHPAYRWEAAMAILLIEYRTPNFAEWKGMFDRDPMDRGGHGVTRHWLYQEAGDPNHIILSLEFPSAERAKAFLNALEPVRDVSGVVLAWVLDESETAEY